MKVTERKIESQKKRILLVDDEISILRLLDFILKEDYELVAKNNGFDALTWLDEGNIPDLIISDMEMPYFDGAAFVKSLKVSGYFREVPVIVLSGSETLENIKMKIPYEINELMSKPFNPSILKDKIKVILN
ncbi:MAG: response regulator [Bacteroidetes bacterium]|nr:response regulator [Bacteroidota bacterium]MBU1484045.1 response regulator [Bacteroidota bacterium]MBU2267079.1 response regulator [Bacteroidota bacterium]MBU2377353.1 response regulator [Bacteroidota bacterium]